ncbi:peroxisomal membrane protein 11C-like [Rhopilema esculentum]|uniref:peroxisomal membrane protein 11C-like n=1 Tax=Rhopilema esculentum TaxID=499914 RepID=UPI0031DDAF0E
MADVNTRFSQLVTFLETYRGRDKVIRLLNYAAYIASGLLQRLRGKDNDFTTGRLAAELSNLRVMLRLIDDFSMLKYSLSYGIGKHEKDPVCRVLQVIQNFVDQLYYPVEHLAWARDVGLLKGSSNKLWSFGCLLWVISLTMGILSSIRKLVASKNMSEKDTKSTNKEETPVHSSKEYKEIETRHIVGITKQNVSLIVGLCGNLFDLVNGVHWLPQGFLWSSKLPLEVVGLCGTISSLCLLFNAITAV